MTTMTNSNSHSPQTVSKPVNKVAKPAKKADPFVALKSSIMILSMVGTMAGWLLLLNQETDNQSVDTAMLSTSVIAANETVAEPMPIVDISQLRQVNEVQAVEAVTVVARTRSSQ